MYKIALLSLLAVGSNAFMTSPTMPAVRTVSFVSFCNRFSIEELNSSPDESSDVETVEAIVLSAEEEKELGNLVANEEWSGLSMELTEVIATAVVEDLKKNSRDFLGKISVSHILY